MGSEGASCFHTLSDESRDVSKAIWDLERFGQLCTKPENFANWKEAILELCHQTKQCTFEQKKTLDELMSRVESFQRRLQ